MKTISSLFILMCLFARLHAADYYRAGGAGSRTVIKHRTSERGAPASPGTALIAYTANNPPGHEAAKTVTAKARGFTLADRVLSVTKTADAAEPGINGGFAVSLPPGINAEEDITVTYTVGGTAGASDYAPLTGTAVIPTGMNHVSLPVTVANDHIIENTETVQVTLGGATGTAYTYTLSTTGGSAAVNITDDDNTPVNRTLSAATGSHTAEGAPPGSFRITLPANMKAAEDIHVTYTIAGTAANGTDHAMLNGSVVLPAGQGFVDIPVAAVDDKVIEGNETVTLTLTGGTTASIGNIAASATQRVADLNITDNDNTPASRTLSVTSGGNVAEPSSNSSFTISLPADITAMEAITVNYAIGGTALNGADYTAMAGTAVIAAGQNSVTIPVTVTNDGEVETIETVTLTLGSGASANFFFTASTTAGNASLNIADDDNTAANRVLSIAKDADAAEPVTSGGFRISLPSGIKASENINVTYSIGAGTATPGTDYRAITGTVTIPAGASDVFVPVTIIDNSVIEPAETVIMNISGGASANFTYTVGTGSATVNIADNDFTPGSNVVMLTKLSDALEGGSNGQFRISLPPGVTSSNDVVIPFAIDPTSTAGATDYAILGLSSGTIVLPAGANEIFIDIDAGNDGVIEGPEKVKLTLTGASSASYPFTIDPANKGGEVNIIDANSASSTPLQVIAGSNAAEPSTNAAFTLKLAGVATSAWPVTIGYRLSGTAVSGSDYEAIGTLVIPANRNSIPVNLTVVDDKIIEPTETMTFTIISGSATDGGGNAFIFPPDPANNGITVNIADNDAVDANLALSVTKTTDAAEPSATGAYTVSLPAGYSSSANITLSYAMTGTAVRNTDYSIFTITLPAYHNSVPLPLFITDDRIIEGTETAVLNLNGGTDGNSFTYDPVSGANTATMNLADNDLVPANMVLTATNSGNAAEPGTNGSFRISLPAGITVAQQMTVNYTVGGTAAPGDDYAGLSATATIVVGGGGVTVPVVINNDQLIEHPETVTLTVSGGTAGSMNFTPAAGGSAMVHIADDDNTPANTVLDITAGPGIAEGAAGTFTVSLPGSVPAPEDVTVQYTVSGTALGGTDYIALSGTAVIPAGQHNVAINLSSINDLVLEPTETVILTLTGATSNNFSWTISGVAGKATLHIMDNDNTPANRSLAVEKMTDATEPATGGMFRVSLPVNITVAEDVTVNYSVTGTAAPGADYTALTGTVVIPAGEDGVNIPVAVVNDQALEQTETVIVTLNGGSSASFAFTGTGNATVSITDDESSVPANVTLTVTKTADAAEPGTNGGFSIHLPAGRTFAENVTVTYTIAGTATAGTDYAALTGTAAITAGQSSVNVPVTAINDQLIEQDETVIVTVTGGSSTSFTFTGGGSATVTIADDERSAPASRALTVSKGADGAEPGTNGAFIIHLPAGVLSTESITVNYTISGTAAAGNDYTAITGAIIVPAGQPGVTVPVTVSNDQAIEPVETVVMTLAGGASTSFTFTGNGNATVHITDDESAAPANRVLSIANNGNAKEPATGGGFTISLPAGIITSEAITIPYTVAGTATDADYAKLSGTAVIAAGEGSTTIPVAVIDDQLIEGEENVIVSFNGGSSTSFTFAGTGSATVNITDDDNINLDLQVTATIPAAAEPATNGQFTIGLAGGKVSSEAIAVQYTVTGTATAGTDYTPITGTITIPAGAGATTIPVQVINDEDVEGAETVVFRVTGGRSAGYTYTAGSAATAVVTITSEDVHKGDLKITKQMVQPATGPYRMGQDITYRILLTNIGSGMSTGVAVTDSLAAQLGQPIRTVTDRGQAVVNTAGRTVTWTIGDLAAGATVQLEVSGRLIDGGLLAAGAEALSSNTDVDPGNNKATLTIQVEGADLLFMNTFTPNGDGKNEHFVIGGLEKYKGAKLQVFNRWGGQVYRSNDYRNDWNGSGLLESTYYYILEVTKDDGSTKSYKGWVLIIR